MSTELCKEYPLLFGAVLTIVFLIAQAVVIGLVDDPLADKMLERLFYVSAVLCTVRLMWATACVLGEAIDESKGEWD